MWTAYYLELHAVICFVAALGIWRVVSILASRLSRQPAPSTPEPRVAPLFLAFAAALTLSAIVQVQTMRSEKLEWLEAPTGFRERMRRIAGPAIVFVRYGGSHDMHRSLAETGDDLSRKRVWVVHDRGEDNARLLRLVPARVPFLYDEAHRSLRPLAPPAANPD